MSHIFLRKQFVFHWAERSGHDQYLSAISVFSLSSDLCRSSHFVLCLFLHFVDLLRQATASTGLLSLPNKSKPTIKTVLKTWPKTFEVLGKTCTRLSILGQDLLKTFQVLANSVKFLERQNIKELFFWAVEYSLKKWTVFCYDFFDSWKPVRKATPLCVRSPWHYILNQ